MCPYCWKYLYVILTDKFGPGITNMCFCINPACIKGRHNINKTDEELLENGVNISRIDY